MIRIGVIGCGYWGPNLLRNFDSLPECSVAMVCDTNVSRLEDMKSQYPHIEVTQHSEQIIQNPDIDAVAICTPVHTHFQLARQCLENHKHTLIEKPMAENVEQCEILLDIATNHQLTLMVGHTFIYSSVVRKIKEIIDSGELGEIQYIASRRLNLGLFQKDINVAWDLAPHDLSIILYLAHEAPVAVNCQGKAHITPGIEDVTNITLDFENGCFATVHNSWLDPNKIREMIIVGKNKMLLYDDIQPLEKIKIYDKHVVNPPYYKNYAEFQFSYHYGDTYVLRTAEGALQIEYSHFLDCIRTGKEPDTPAETV